jgi:hypothetical protein
MAPYGVVLSGNRAMSATMAAAGRKKERPLQQLGVAGIGGSADRHRQQRIGVVVDLNAMREIKKSRWD